MVFAAVAADRYEAMNKDELLVSLESSSHTLKDLKLAVMLFSPSPRPLSTPTTRTAPSPSPTPGKAFNNTSIPSSAPISQLISSLHLVKLWERFSSENSNTMTSTLFDNINHRDGSICLTGTSIHLSNKINIS